MARVARSLLLVLCLAASMLGCASSGGARGKPDSGPDPYADFVWPAPPDEPRIKLEAVITGRVDVEAKGKLQRSLLGASPGSVYDRLERPFAVAFDGQGRILVSDAGHRAILRFDRAGGRMDVLGTQGRVRLSMPLGLDVGADGTIYVADGNLASVVAYDPEGDLVAVYGRAGELENPTDAAVSPDGSQLFVADSKAHEIVVFDLESGEIASRFGEVGEEERQFHYPTSLAFGPEGDLFVVDQLNTRVQVLTAEGDFVDQFGHLGVGFANFVRPKDVAVDEVGFIYVTDNAFNNLQIFDADFSLLTYVGEGGQGPGRFHGASGVAVRGRELAVVDQLGRRLQVFRFIVPKDQ